MRKIEECMEIIAYAGDAKSLAMMAIQKAREGLFEEAEKKLKEAQDSMVKSHQVHSELLFYDAEHEDLSFSMLLIHAADHLTSADMAAAMAEEMIYLYKEVRHV